MASTHAYIYDDFLTERRFERPLAELETTLNSYDLAGHIGRLALFRTPRDLVQSMVKRGAMTMVVVGNDVTLSKMIDALFGLDVTVGYIPFSKPHDVASLLSIPVGVKACDALSMRWVETFDVGKIDDRVFLMDVAIDDPAAQCEIEGHYRVAARDEGSILIRNVGGLIHDTMKEANGKDGWLEAVVVPRLVSSSGFFGKTHSSLPTTCIPFQHGRIMAPHPIRVRVDQHELTGTNFSISIVPQALKMITGRTRRLSTADGGLPSRKPLAKPSRF